MTGPSYRARQQYAIRLPANANLLRDKEVVFRADAAFSKPEIYEALEERGGLPPR